MGIKNINDGINWRTIPKAIKDEFKKNGHIREETHTRNAKGVMEVTYGGIMRPIFAHYKYDGVDFYVNLKFWEHFYELLNLGLLFDENLNIISNENTKPFYIEYSKGFNKGFSEFEDTLKNDNSLFKTSNEHIVYKVYSRVINEKKGTFPMYSTFDFNQNDLEKQIRKEKKLKLLFKLNKESFFKSGFEGGEFYKAWELILNNPTVFEPIFKANVKNEITPEPEPLDLSDNLAVEKTSFINEFDTVQESKIIEYFTKNLVDKNYISVEVLNNYLKQAFELKTPPKQKFSFEKLPTQAKIKKVFYEYWSITAGKPNGRKRDYVELLGEYFTGFNTDKLITNFSK